MTLRLPNSPGSHLCSLAPAAPGILIIIMSAECPLTDSLCTRLYSVLTLQCLLLIDLANTSASLSLIYMELQIYTHSVIFIIRKEYLAYSDQFLLNYTYGWYNCQIIAVATTEKVFSFSGN